jgi:hypothetical protein
VHNESADWKLERFPEAIDRWIDRESPDDEIRLIVINWIINRHDDPYRGMRREDHPNLWFGPIRDTQAAGAVVTCSYWIYESTRRIVCNDICTLNQPI